MVLCAVVLTASWAACGGKSAQDSVDLRLVNRLKLSSPQATVIRELKSTPIRVHTATGYPDRKHPRRRATYTCYAYRVRNYGPADYVELCFALNELQSVFSAVSTPTGK
jgi:hypothetical protein